MKEEDNVKWIREIMADFVRFTEYPLKLEENTNLWRSINSTLYCVRNEQDLLNSQEKAAVDKKDKTRSITQSEFIKEYCDKSHITEERLNSLGEVAVPCDCGHWDCKGWAMKNKDNFIITPNP